MGAATPIPVFEASGTSGQVDQLRKQAQKYASETDDMGRPRWVDRWGNYIGADGKAVLGLGTRLSLQAGTPDGFYDKYTAWDEYEPGKFAFADTEKWTGKPAADTAAAKAMQPLDMADIVLRAAGKVKTTTGYDGSFLTGPAENPVDRAARKFSQEKLILDAAKLRGLK